MSKHRIAVIGGDYIGPEVVAEGLKVMTPAEAARWANVVMLLVPDQHMGDLYLTDIAPNLPRVVSRDEWLAARRG